MDSEIEKVLVKRCLLVLVRCRGHRKTGRRMGDAPPRQQEPPVTDLP